MSWLKFPSVACSVNKSLPRLTSNSTLSPGMWPLIVSINCCALEMLLLLTRTITSPAFRPAFDAAEGSTTASMRAAFSLTANRIPSAPRGAAIFRGATLSTPIDTGFS
jgi:hypothetical protein